MRPWTVTPAQWGSFLSAVFDEWQVRWRRKVSIRNFDAVLHLLIDGAVVSCDHGSRCDDYLVVEHNGDVYPCDFFVEPELKLGNCTESSWESLRASPLYISFGKHKLANSKECGTCAYIRLCRGDCIKHRGPGMENAGVRSYLCEGLKTFYHHTMPGFLRMAENYRKRS